MRGHRIVYKKELEATAFAWKITYPSQSDISNHIVDIAIQSKQISF